MASAKKLCNSCHACKRLFFEYFFSVHGMALSVGVDVMLQPTGRVYPGLCLHRADTASACVSTCCCLAVGLRLYTQSLSTTQLIHERTLHEAGQVACEYRNRNPCPSKAGMRYSLPLCCRLASRSSRSMKEKDLTGPHKK